MDHAAIPQVIQDPSLFLECLRRDGAVILDCSDALQQHTYEQVASELPWKLFGHRCKASLAPTRIQMLQQADGQVQAVTYGQQSDQSIHMRHGAALGSTKTTQEKLDPLHVDGTKAYGYNAPDVIFLLCEFACAEGGANFLVDAEKLVQDCGPEMEQALRSTPVDQVYFSVTAAGKGLWRGPLVSKTSAGKTLVQCPNVFEGEELDRVRPCSDELENYNQEDVKELIAKFAQRMRTAQEEAPRFKLKKNHVLCVDNFRMWHGREPFKDLRRTLWRVWTWTDACNGLPQDLPEGANTKRDCEI